MFNGAGSRANRLLSRYPARLPHRIEPVCNECVARVIYRINHGGPEAQALDGGASWEADDGHSPYWPAWYAESWIGRSVSYTSVGRHASLPSYVPDLVARTERFDTDSNNDQLGNNLLTYLLPIPNGDYELRIIMGSTWGDTAAVGSRLFSLRINNYVPPDLENIDLVQLFGHKNIGMLTQQVRVTDGEIKFQIVHGDVDNPLINGLEIIEVDIAPPSYIFRNGALENDAVFGGDAPTFDGNLIDNTGASQTYVETAVSPDATNRWLFHAPHMVFPPNFTATNLFMFEAFGAWNCYFRVALQPNRIKVFARNPIDNYVDSLSNWMDEAPLSVFDLKIYIDEYGGSVLFNDNVYVHTIYSAPIDICYTRFQYGAKDSENIYEGKMGEASIRRLQDRMLMLG